MDLEQRCLVVLLKVPEVMVFSVVTGVVLCGCGDRGGWMWVSYFLEVIVEASDVLGIEEDLANSDFG